MKALILWFLSFVFLFSFVSATCPLMDVSTVSHATIQQGVTASFPITFTNRDVNSKLVQLSGTCAEGMGCSFTPLPYKTIAASETHTFTLQVSAVDSKPGNYTVPAEVIVGGVSCQNYYFGVTVKEAPESQQKPFEVKVTPAGNQTARPLGEITYFIDIKNNKAEKGYARLEAKTPLEVDFDAIDVDVEPNSQKTIKARVFVPAGTSRETYDVLFIVNAFEGSGCCEYQFAFNREVFVFADNVKLALQNAPLSCMAAQHGNETTRVFTIRNDGEKTGPFSFSIDGLSSVTDFVSLDASLLEISAGDSQQLTLKMKPSGAVPLSSYPFRLIAKYLDHVVFEKPLCVEVDAAHNFRLFGPEEVELTRGESAQVDFLVRNTGTIKETYVFTSSVPPSFDSRLLEDFLTVLPGKEKNASIALSTTMKTPLGPTNLLFSVSDGAVTKVVNTSINIVSSSKPGKSFLDVLAKPLEGYSGVNSSQTVSVRNNALKTQYNLSLSINGLPEGWASVATDPKHVLSGKTATYDIALNIPKDSPETRKTFSYVAQSQEGEKTEAFNVLSVTKPPAHLNLAVANVVRQGDTVQFSVVVYNNGALPLSGVVVQAGEESVLVDVLAPGEQKLLAFQALAAAPLVVKARSNEGVESNAQTIQPPAVVDSIDTPLFVAVIVLILVIIALAFLMRKEQLEEFVRQTK